MDILAILPANIRCPDIRGARHTRSSQGIRSLSTPAPAIHRDIRRSPPPDLQVIPRPVIQRLRTARRPMGVKCICRLPDLNQADPPRVNVHRHLALRRLPLNPASRRSSNCCSK
jgi:hypothetical protein